MPVSVEQGTHTHATTLGATLSLYAAGDWEIGWGWDGDA